jgi:hypothetical protein
VIDPSIIYESHADARPDGTHTDWSTPQILPTVSGKRWDTYLRPHVAPDGTVWTTTTNNPQPQQSPHAADHAVLANVGAITHAESEHVLFLPWKGSNVSSSELTLRAGLQPRARRSPKRDRAEARSLRQMIETRGASRIRPSGLVPLPLARQSHRGAEV